MPIARFLADRRASIAPLFALILIPVIGLAGAAVDYSRGNSVHAAMQAAVDATALMISKEQITLTDAQLNQKAWAFFKAQFTRAEAYGVQIKVKRKEIGTGSYKIDVSATAKVATTFAKVLGKSQLDIGVESQVIWGMRKLEIALAFDNTGSMAQNGKMPALKKASKELLKALEKTAKKSDDVRVAIIPFVNGVNIGTKFQDEFWIDYDAEKVDKKKWKGCVADRDQSNDVLDTTPVKNDKATYFPALADCGDLPQVQPLTNDWSALNKLVEQMKPINGKNGGNTNTTIGLVWAWHALTPSLPLTEGKPADPSTDKVIIMMTDGDNTANRWTSLTPLIDARTKKVCDNIRAANIKLYTVRVIQGNGALLLACASSPSMYFNVEQASQLSSAFGAISQNLANLRISK